MTLPRNRAQRDNEAFEENSGDQGVDRRVVVKNTAGDPANVSFTPSPSAITIYNKAVPSADTEVSQSINSNTRQLIIRARGNTVIKFSFVATESGTKFTTIPVGSSLSLDNINLSSATIYLQTSKASQIVEILEIT